MDARGPNAGLIGAAGARDALVTPALLLDLDVLDANLALMHGHCRAVGLACRPHCKGHKSPDMARRQIAAGAIGISCATVAEAETMAGAGIASILLTAAPAGARALERVGALAERAAELIVAVDRAEAVAALGALAVRRGRRIGVLVDLDVGQRRTGVTSPQAACDLAATASRTAGIDYAGVQAYWGHLQHVAAHADRRRAIAEPMERLAAAVDALRRAGLPPRIVSGGGTGSCDVDYQDGLFTENQPGSYVMMDAQYDAVEIWPGNARRFGPAMRVLGRVVSAHQPDRATLDAGSKALSTDGPPPRFLAPARARDAYAFAGDEFGIVRYADGPGSRLAVGDPVEMLAPHCDTTANLHAFFHCLRGDRLAEVWPIVGRGAW